MGQETETVSGVSVDPRNANKVTQEQPRDKTGVTREKMDLGVTQAMEMAYSENPQTNSEVELEAGE